MIVVPKRLLKPRMVTCGRLAAAAVAAAASPTGGGRRACGAIFIAWRSLWRASERLQVLLHVDLFRHHTDRLAEIGELLQIAELLRIHVLGHDVTEHRH